MMLCTACYCTAEFYGDQTPAPIGNRKRGTASRTQDAIVLSAYP